MTSAAAPWPIKAILPGAILAAILLTGTAALAKKNDQVRPQATIESVRAQLYYELSGTLSANIASPASFSGWNTVIGEGDAREAAQDLLVSVRLKGDGSDGFLTDRPLIITAWDRKGKVIGRRSVNSILVPYQGTVSTALWLPDVTCIGKLSIEARFGNQVRRETVSLDCGE